MNAFGIMMFGNFANLIMLDLLIVGTLTPVWIIIPGTEHLKENAKDFRRIHTKGDIWGTVSMAFLCLIIADVIGII